MIRSLRRLYVDLCESIRIAGEQLNAHKFRSLLTALGVIIGVWAVISIGIAIDGLNRGFNKSLDMLGSDTIYVQKWPWKDVGDDWVFYRNRRAIQTTYAEELNEIFAETPNSVLVVAVPTSQTQRSISRGDRRVGDVDLTGTNSDFEFLNNAEIEYGRFFTGTEAASGRNVVILGSDVADGLFGGSEQAVGKEVSISQIKYTVIGVYAAQGSFLGLFSFDNQAVLPLKSMRKFYSGRRWWGGQDSVQVMKKPGTPLEVARDELTGAMRRVRGLMPGEDNDFELNASDAVEDTLGPVKSGIAVAGFAITGLSLFVGAVGIMNITFVSVKERTKEIGTRRAIGARSSSILLQFLTEAVAVCLVGGAVGLASAYLTKTMVLKFVPSFLGAVSPALILFAFGISVLVGILAGFVPAWLASRLDPATALRHE
jgi:putative ABC transport system permease protein